MNDFGLFRIMAVSPESFPIDIGMCFETIAAVMSDALSQNVSLLLLPELCLTSASCGDLFYNDSILQKAEESAIQIARATKDNEIICCFSFPFVRNGELFSVAALAFDGEIAGIVPLLPNKSVGTDVFSEYTGEDTDVLVGGQIVPFGRDLRFEFGDSRDITIRIGKNPERCSDALIYLIPDACLAWIGKQAQIRDWCRYSSEKNSCTIVYCSAGEGETTSFGAFSGQVVIAKEGEIVAEVPTFGTGCCIADIELSASDYDKLKEGSVHTIARNASEHFLDKVNIDKSEDGEINCLPFLGNRKDISTRCEEVFEIQSRGLAGRLKKTGISKAILGVSGGIDSTLALLVSVRAIEILGGNRTQVIAVSMPCFGTSDRTKTNAQKLCEELGVAFRVIDISDSVCQHLKDIGHNMKKTDTAYENAQARERTQVLMDLANMENGLVVGTGDMSESALGWCTFNGDHMSMYNVNCSVTKTMIRAIVSNYAENCNNTNVRNVLLDIVDTPVSPELKPSAEGAISQKTEEILGPYEVHDFFLYHLIKNHYSPKRIFDLAVIAFGEVYTREQIYNWLKIFIRRFVQNQFKRSCAPDGPLVGPINLSSIGWNTPSDLSALWLLEQLG